MKPSAQAQTTEQARTMPMQTRSQATSRRRKSSTHTYTDHVGKRVVTGDEAKQPPSKEALDRAGKLLSETAHDIKSPLTGIRETMRLMRNGDIGRVSLLQREVLDDAIGQCDLIASIADNMLQVDRLRNGLPSVTRSWVSPADIAGGLSGLVQSLATPRRVQVVWKGFESSAATLFADPHLLRRILLNLVGNAITVSEERANIEVALVASIRHGMSRIMVTDHGPGIPEQDIAHLSGRGASGTGSTGLGLQICKSLAALHFARISMRSQLGQGTRMMMELPSGGPSSIALAFARWREIVAPARGSFGMKKPTLKRTSHNRSANSVTDTSRDVLPRGLYKDEIVLPFDGLPPRVPNAVQTIGVRAPDGESADVVEEMNQVLQGDQRMHELVYRTDARRWIAMWDCEADEVRHRVHELRRRLQQECRSVNAEWLMPLQIHVGQQSDRALIHDMLVRDTLHANARRPMFDDHEMFMDVIPDALSEKAAARLEREIKQLSKRMRGQSGRLKRQADQLVRMTDSSPG